VPVRIVVEKGSKPVPKVVRPAEVVQQATAAGSPHANTAMAVTRSFYVKADLIKDLEMDTRPPKPQKPTEFRFTPNSVLRLSLVHKIYIKNTLSPCARNIVQQHEQEHVKDVQSPGFKKRLEEEIRSHKDLQYILVNPQWYLLSSAAVIRGRIERAVEGVFDAALKDVLRKRDTQAEFARIQRSILQTCPGPFHHEVIPGDTLSKLALFYYGSRRLWPSIYRQNRSLIGGDPDLIHPGQRLVIPKNP
jgi:nucleoid-associated protein YgaU